MKISLRWLNEFVDIKEFLDRPDQLADLLTKAGLEVEEIIQKAKDFNQVVVGLILEKEQHPNATKLSLCKVMTGNGVVHQIVCGAQNHKKDDKVVVALPGAVLPGGLNIQKAVLRGVESSGMLCSKKELGLLVAGENEPGLYILPPNAPIGEPIAKFLGLDDVYFELKVTPNRADCLSHLGLAREVSCLLDRKVNVPAVTIAAHGGSTKSWIGLEVRSKLCQRYMGRGIRGVKIAESPDWLKKRLEGLGFNSINNVVDITNYVMIETGQPLHAFDAREIHGQKVIVDLAKANEEFTTLDGTKIKLSGEELMIRDMERPLALAGVVGGKNSGVNNDTKDLFIEAAYFPPATVRKTARTHGITTDSAYRFSRGVNPEGTPHAMDRAVELILQLAGGEAMSEPHDDYPEPIKREPIVLSIESFSEKLGFKTEPALLENILSRLKCEVVSRSANEFTVRPPPFRFDLEAEVDFIEEYARLRGYDLIPETLPPTSNVPPSTHDTNYLATHRISEIARSLGCTQALNLIFSAQDSNHHVLEPIAAWHGAGFTKIAEPVSLVNPLSAEQGILRQTLADGLLKNVQHNFHQGEVRGRLFEQGKVFSKSADGKYLESQRLAFVFWGQSEGLWNSQNHPLIYDLKSVVESLCRQLHVSVQFVSVDKGGEVPSLLHPGQFARVLVGKNKTPIGFLASLNPQWNASSKVRVPVAIAELDGEALIATSLPLHKISEFSRFPKMERDLALVMPKSMVSSQVVEVIQSAGGESLRKVLAFDLYEGDKLPTGKKSVAYRLVFQDFNGTLQENAVNEAMQRIQMLLGEKLSVQVR